MTPELREFINEQDEAVQPALNEYYELYLKENANNDETKASNDILAFCKRIQSNPDRDLESEITNKIDEMKGPELDRGLGARLKKSKKSKRRTPGRVKKDASNPCSLRNKKQCGGDPNCHYVKRRGCTRRRGAATKGQVYEGPMMPADMY